jgi:hypothetical protein
MGDVVLHRGDALDILPTLAAGGVDDGADRPGIRVCRDWGPTGWHSSLSEWRLRVRKLDEED